MPMNKRPFYFWYDLYLLSILPAMARKPWDWCPADFLSDCVRRSLSLHDARQAAMVTEFSRSTSLDWELKD